MQKKGFTLIELLSVIIILGVIALITTPIVLNLVENSKEQARIQSVISYADAIKLSYLEEEVNNTGTSLEELANKKMQGSEVKCDILQYNQNYGSVLHGCKVKNENNKGNYCYINGNVYNVDSIECARVLNVVENGDLEHKTPIITVVSKNPSNTTYSQNKQIKIEYPTIDIIEEFFYVKVNRSIELDNVLGKCGTGKIPSTCESNTDGSIEIDTWYKVSGDITFTINNNVTIQAITGDDSSYSNRAEYKEQYIDNTKPIAIITNVSTTSSKAVVYDSCKDLESGISKVEYLVNGGEYQNSNVFENLTIGNKYKFKIRCTNGSGMVSEAETEEITLSEVIAPTIEQISQTPENSTYATKRIIRITYNETNVENPTHYYSLDGKTWTEVTSTIYDVTFTSNGYLYAKTVDDKGNTANAATYTVENIDATNPNTNISVGNIKTDRATITAMCNDNESGITKYEFSNDNGINWISNGTTPSYTFTDLNQSTEYTFAVRCTNGSGLTNTKTGKESTTGIVNPIIEQISQTPDNSTYATKRVIRITYNGTNIENPKYYYSLDGKTWTEVTSTIYDVTFTSNGYLYAKTVDDKGNTASAATYTVENIYYNSNDIYYENEVDDSILSVKDALDYLYEKLQEFES